MQRLRSVLTPVITAASVLALSGIGLAQAPSGSHREASARAHEFMSSAPCPLAKVTKDKISEEEARDLAQGFADKNWTGFKVVRPLSYGGGYTTMCYQAAAASAPAAPLLAANAAPTRPLVLYSVEYSMDLKNPTGETRNLCVDQYGFVTEFCGDFAMAGATGPMGPAGPMGAQGPAGATGAQGQLGSVGPQAQAAPTTQWTSFRDFLFDFDKSEIRANETKHVSDIAAYMKQNPAVQVGIDGHTDPRGTDSFNQGLSERRVNVISEALITAGVSRGRIKAGAFGESRPKCSAPSEACWQSDRRVEVLISNAQTASR